MNIAIIGGGPIGLYMAIKCQEHHFNYHIFEATDHLGGQLMELYPQKIIYNIPNHGAVIAQEYIKELLTNINLDRVSLNTTVEDLQQLSAHFDYVIVATGLGAYTHRRLNLPNESASKRNILYSLTDYSFLANKQVIVLGGGDSALDWSATLSDIANVTLVHRRDVFRGNEATIRGKPVKLYLSYQPIKLDKSQLWVQSIKDGKIVALDYDYILVNYGRQYQKPTFTITDNVFLVGDCLDQTKTIAFGQESVNHVITKLIEYNKGNKINDYH